VFHSAHRPAARTAALTPIHFSHANGFPAPCYRKLFDGLGSDLRIGHLDRIGHDPRFPVTDGWGNLVDELIHAVERRWLEPVLGIGHSLGGFLTAMAAARRPDLFRAIILLDAPILGRFQGSAMQFAKRIGLIDRMTPAASTRSRRREWPSREDALAHFRRRRVFAKFDAACLEDYVRFGLVDHARGVQLWFDPDIETRIYRTIPHDVAGSIKTLRVPAGFIGGRDSGLVKQVGLRITRRSFHVALVPGGHHFPFQLPEVAAAAIRRMAQDLGAL
jgi:pimeloyl-ACP methyl ester carboxylesterase